MINLITTDSYFNIFDILVNLIGEQEKDRTINPHNHNLVFCEEKVSLMIERMICHKLKGSFNTDVYSFGNYLRAKKSFDKVLSKEGSSMAVQRILRTVPLRLFKSGKNGLAPTLYELIIQLKSAKVTPQDLYNASLSTTGLLKNKLQDIYTVYGEYERFIDDMGFDDQSSVLSYLDDILLNSDEISNSNIYIVGFSGFTAQIRSAISILMDRGKTFTAILTDGKNEMAFVNETANVIENMGKEKAMPVLRQFVSSSYSESGKIIKDCLFNPVEIRHQTRKNNSVDNGESALSVADSKSVFFKAQPDITDEIKSVAEIIKREVMSGNSRYRDMTIAVPDTIQYGNYIRDIFFALNIPYFLDEKKKPDNHPLITLILSYIDMFRKGFDRKDVLDFVKNPLFESDKNLCDNFENYVLKYNITRNKFKEPFTLFDEKEDGESLNLMRERLVKYFDNFSVENMLKDIDAENKISSFSEQLQDLNKLEDKAVNDQIYQAVTNILEEMELMLGGIKLSYIEYKNTFLSGISALKLSIIPQYNDAVFIGNYKEVALYKAKYLFAVGLTSSVPDIKKDVALLSDNDIDLLNDIKVMVEPKIKIVNHRVRENMALALAAFNERLYLSYPVSSVDGSKNAESEVIGEIKTLLKVNDFPENDNYLTLRQGISSFARECGEFSECSRDDIESASSFYKAVAEVDKTNKEQIDAILKRSNREIKVKLNQGQKILVDKETSPTLIEEYHQCPYKVFISRGLKLRERDESGVNALSLGTLMHDVFKIYAEHIENIEDLDDEKIFEDAFNSVIAQDKYKRFLFDVNTKHTISRIKKECRRYTLKIFHSINDSQFRVYKTEAEIGDGYSRYGGRKPFRALPVAGGKVKIKGSIDRIDLSKNYYRVLDYKTGSVDDSDKSLFNGMKLQLYLYSAAIDEKMKADGKKLAGCYYLPSWDNYQSEADKKNYDAFGKTLDEKDSLKAQGADPDKLKGCDFLPVRFCKNGSVKGVSSESELKSYMEYAVKLSSLAVERMLDGFIVPSPYENCDYCKYKGFCNFEDAIVRKVNKVTPETIAQAVKGDKHHE